MFATIASVRRAARRGHALTAAATLLLISTSASLAQFQATVDEDGNTTVLNAGGQEVPIAPAEPVGTKPMDCPIGAFYVSEVPNDTTELVLTDCATGQQQYTVEMAGQPQ